MSDDLFNKVNTVLESIRPALIADGGNVELVEVKDGKVSLKLQGACGHCPMSQMTLKMGIEREIKRQIPEIQQVIAI